MDTETRRVESEESIKSYISSLRYALKNGAKINFQSTREIDKNRNPRHTNKYTISELFPDENPIEAIKRELLTLTEENYICSLKDIRFPNKSEMRVFGKTYNCTEDVYIKIRVELIDPNSSYNSTTFVMSFHFAEKDFTEKDFPYKKS